MGKQHYKTSEVIPNLFRDPTCKVIDKQGDGFANWMMKQFQHYFLSAGKSLCCSIMLFAIACTTKPNTPIIHISLSSNKQSLRITGFDNAIAQDINRDPAGRGWQTLLPVYRMPADTGMKNYQPVQPGTYKLSNNAVIFTPDTPFTAQQTYFLRYYKFGTNSDPAYFISGQNRLGNLPYTDLNFKQ